MSGKRQNIVVENVRIESVAAEGKAIAHIDGVVTFIEHGVPGDVVNILITKKKRNYCEGVIKEIVSPSEHRLEPICPHFGICGGCKWQILPYEMQLEAKRQQVVEQMIRIGHLDVPEVSPTLPSSRTDYYRNKLEFSCSPKRWILPGEDADGLSDAERCGIGFHVGRFFDKVLDIRDCHLQREPSNAIRLFVKDFALKNGISFHDVRSHSGLLRGVLVRTAENGQIMVIVCFFEDVPKLRNALLDALTKMFPSITSLFYIINSKQNDSIADQECILYSGDDAIYEKLGRLTFKIGPKSFFQTNTLQAENLYDVAKGMAALTGSETVYDLYTGTGTIAQYVSDGAKKVIGIEYVPEAIEDARENAARNGIGNCEFFAGDMKDVLNRGFIDAHGHPDVMIVDPPRAGMHPSVVEVILQASPSRIVYVSCNPASQARDLAMLAPKYRITAVQPVDMFPHTQHVENVCALELK